MKPLDATCGQVGAERNVWRVLKIKIAPVHACIRRAGRFIRLPLKPNLRHDINQFGGKLNVIKLNWAYPQRPPR